MDAVKVDHTVDFCSSNCNFYMHSPYGLDIRLYKYINNIKSSVCVATTFVDLRVYYHQDRLSL